MTNTLDIGHGPGAPDSPISVTHLSRSARSDWHVSACRETTGLPVPFAQTDIVAQLRSFFDQLEAEAEARRDDPVAMVNVLARMEALLADMRYVTGLIRGYTAEALAALKIRRITVEELATMEASSTSDRTDWEDQRLLRDMITALVPTMINADTGEVIDNDVLAETILQWFRVAWRLTPIREAGLDPDDYSQQGERTPTVRVHENLLRKEQVTQ